MWIWSCASERHHLSRTTAPRRSWRTANGTAGRFHLLQVLFEASAKDEIRHALSACSGKSGLGARYSGLGDADGWAFPQQGIQKLLFVQFREILLQIPCQGCVLYAGVTDHRSERRHCPPPHMLR